MNEFLLLAIIIVYLVVKPPPQRADENIPLSRPQKKSNKASRSSTQAMRFTQVRKHAHWRVRANTERVNIFDRTTDEERR